MKSHPILFQGDMVRAILNCKPGVWPAAPIDPAMPFKFQTRRIIKRQPQYVCDDWTFHAEVGDKVIYKGWPHRLVESRGRNKSAAGELTPQRLKCPYGVPGDELYVKETFQLWRDLHSGHAEIWEGTIGFAEGCTSIEYQATSDSRGPWRPSIHMPRWACRLHLENKRVRVERVQEIDCYDAYSEGVNVGPPPPGCDAPEPPQGFEQWSNERREDWFTGMARTVYFARCADADDHVKAFRTLWDSINAKRGYSWESKPWVWVVDFMRKVEKP